MNIGVELTPKERIRYDQTDKMFKSRFEIFNKNLNLMYKCMKNKGLFRNHLIRHFQAYDISPDEKKILYNTYKSYPFECSKAMGERKTILYNASNKIKIVQKISKLFSNRKGIIFSESTKFADLIDEKLGDICVVEHSKVKPASKRKQNIKQFQDGRTKITRISAVRSLNEGANLNEVEFAAIASGTSKLKDFIQRAGRSIRWKEDKKALIFRLYVKNSQEEKWIASSQEGYQTTEIINLNNMKNYV